jgi:hypothetical protein
VYLNDHLAGSAAALELLAELQKAQGVASWASRVRSDIAEDHEELEGLMRRAGIARSPARQTVAWVTEKVAQLKTRVDDRSNGFLQRLELIETLALGIDGKRALWTALQAAADEIPALQQVDYTRLIERAEQQRRLVETHRLQAAADALSRRV